MKKSFLKERPSAKGCFLDDLVGLAGVVFGDLAVCSVGFAVGLV